MLHGCRPETQTPLCGVIKPGAGSRAGQVFSKKDQKTVSPERYTPSKYLTFSNVWNCKGRSFTLMPWRMLSPALSTITSTKRSQSSWMKIFLSFGNLQRKMLCCVNEENHKPLGGPLKRIQSSLKAQQLKCKPNIKWFVKLYSCHVEGQTNLDGQKTLQIFSSMPWYQISY